MIAMRSPRMSASSMLCVVSMMARPTCTHGPGVCTCVCTWALGEGKGDHRLMAYPTSHACAKACCLFGHCCRRLKFFYARGQYLADLLAQWTS